MAAGNGYFEVVKELFIKVDSGGLAKAISNAMVKGQHHIVSFLLNKVDPKEFGEVFTAAALNGYLSVIKELLNKVGSEELSKALKSAAFKGHLEVVRELFAKVDSKDLIAALSSAIDYNKAEIVSFLLDANVEYKNEDIKWSFEKGHERIANLLLEKRDSNAKSLILLDEVSSPSCSSEFVQYLLMHGAKPDTVAADGTPVLVRATLNEDNKSVRALLDNKANPNLGDTKGQTALMAAALGGNMEVVTMLLKNPKTDLNLVARGYSALKCAIFRGHLNVVQALVAAGATYGDKEVEFAAQNKQEDIVKFFQAKAKEIKEAKVAKEKPSEALISEKQDKGKPLVSGPTWIGSKTTEEQKELEKAGKIEESHLGVS